MLNTSIHEIGALLFSVDMYTISLIVYTHVCMRKLIKAYRKALIFSLSSEFRAQMGLVQGCRVH